MKKNKNKEKILKKLKIGEAKLLVNILESKFYDSIFLTKILNEGLTRKNKKLIREKIKDNMKKVDKILSKKEIEKFAEQEKFLKMIPQRTRELLIKFYGNKKL